jgi:UDP-N-acetylmuramoyl-L-alanyl-D-glutamate--2,6-diaminopimelate ligase
LLREFTMLLSALLQAMPVIKAGADPLQEIRSLAYDSRRVQSGGLFFAISGEKADGHRFIPDALEKGAVALVSERLAPPELTGRWIQVEKIRPALSAAAHTLYGDPDKQLTLAGITGTNGKTTTAFLLDSIFRTLGRPTALFGTIEYRVAGQVSEAPNTTPESLDLLTYLAELAGQGGKLASMEVSSHALAQERVWGVQFSAAVFTNLTQDHLDYHKDMQHYFEAKRRLFEGVGAPPPELAVINVDDPWGQQLLEVSNPHRLTYGISSDAQVKPRQMEHSLEGLQATVSTPAGKVEIHSSLVGRANLYNLLAAVATSIGLGIPKDKVEEGIATLKAVPGRFERVYEGQPFLVIVDYAHTDDALRNVLRTARQLTKNRLITVFGCGGERDRTKRPLMGEAAGSLSDIVVLTSDNPRGEDPLLIMSDALVGLQKTGRPYFAEVDRRVAIQKALREGKEGDVVVLAGKGHETYQFIKGEKIPFDDRRVAGEILRELGYSPTDAGIRKNRNGKHG